MLQSVIPVGCCLALLFSAPAPSSAQDSALRDSFDSRRETSIEGRLVFNKFCTACHGIDGVAGDRAPAMAAQRRYLRRTPQELFDAIQAGIPGSGMPPMNLDDSDAWKIVAWIRTMRAKAIDVPVEGDRPAARMFFEIVPNLVEGGRAAVLKPGSLRESSKPFTTKENRREETISHSGFREATASQPQRPHPPAQPKLPTHAALG